MTETWFWGLLAGLILLAVALSLKTIEALHAKKLAEDELASLRKLTDGFSEQKSKAAQAVNKSNANESSISSVSDHSQPYLYEILVCIATYRSQNLEATPERIATDLALDTDILYAYMWKYHNDQFITFNSGGAKPDNDTSFFLSPKAWQFIAIAKL